MQAAIILWTAFAAGDLCAQSYHWAMPGAGPVHIVAGQTDLQVEVVDLASGLPVSEVTLEEPGDSLLLTDPPQNLAVHTAGIASVQLGTPQPGLSHGSILQRADTPLGSSFAFHGPGNWTLIAARSAATPAPSLTIQVPDPITLGLPDAVALGARVAFLTSGPSRKASPLKP